MLPVCAPLFEALTFMLLKIIFDPLLDRFWHLGVCLSLRPPGDQHHSKCQQLHPIVSNWMELLDSIWKGNSLRSAAATSNVLIKLVNQEANHARQSDCLILSPTQRLEYIFTNTLKHTPLQIPNNITVASISKSNYTVSEQIKFVRKFDK